MLSVQSITSMPSGIGCSSLPDVFSLGFWGYDVVFQTVGEILVLTPPYLFCQTHSRRTGLLEQDLGHLLEIDHVGKCVHMLGAGSVGQKH